MNAKYRALIWEEMRTGGAIAGWSVLVGVLALVAARIMDAPTVLDWRYSAPVALALSVLPLALLGLLLLFRTGNSGALSGGMSGRVLLLPLEVREIVAVILSLRALLLLAATFAMTVACRGLYEGNGPAWVLLLLIPGLYVCIQAIDWLRRPNPLLAAGGFLAVLLTGAVLFAPAAAPHGGFDTPFRSIGTGLLSLVVACAAGYGVALYAAHRCRRGARAGLSLRFSLPEAMPLPGVRVERGFRTARHALLWQFLRRDGLLFPVIFASIGISVAIAYLLFGLYKEDATEYGWAVLDWAVWPVLSLTAMIWGGLRGGAGLQRGIRSSLTDYLHPMSSAEMAATRIWGHALVIGVTWCAALLLSQAGYFLGDGGLLWRIWRDSIAAGESSVRELIGGRLLMPLTILMGAWVLSAIRTRLVAWIIGVAALLATVAGQGYAVAHEHPPVVWMIVPGAFTLAAVIGLMVWGARTRRSRRWIAGLWIAPVGLAVWLGAMSPHVERYLPWLGVFVVIVGALAALVWCGWRGLIPRRHAIGCAVVWIGVAALAYPYGAGPLSGIFREGLLVALLAGALVVLPYPALLLDLHRRRHETDSGIAPEDHAAPGGWGLDARGRAAAWALAAALIVAAAWLRWPAAPAYLATLRAQGVPATFADLAALYGPLPPELNAAPHYLAAVREKEKLNAARNRWRQDQLNQLSDAAETEVSLLYGKDSPVIDGVVGVKPDEPVWTRHWEIALAHQAMVSAPISERLRAIAEAGYPHSHYPIDIGTGPTMGLHHLARIRDLARALSFEIWMASVEDRPADVLPDLYALGALAESLREEPIIMSQLVRIAIHGILTASVEQALNRTAFTEAQLAEMQAWLAGVVPPVEEESMFARAMTGERVFVINAVDSELWQEAGGNPLAVWSAQQFWSVPRVVNLRAFASMLENSGNATSPLLEEIEAASNPIFIMPKILLPALDRSRDAEWRCRVTLDLASLACAVERYRLAHGTLPASLDALAPAFVGSVPRDPFRPDGGPLSYRVTDEGGFVLYTWAQNRQDDGGVPRDRKKKEGNDGDWMFRVAPVTFRDGAQLTEVAPVEEEAEEADAARTSGRRGVSGGR